MYFSYIQGISCLTDKENTPELKELQVFLQGLNLQSTPTEVLSPPLSNELQVRHSEDQSLIR